MRVMELARKYNLKPKTGSNGCLCPECGQELVAIGGCMTCYGCGFSNCG